ncbi:MAG: type II secretion system F family protein [Patescibacteria group bacterium]
MPSYSYKAKKMSGEEIEETREAADKFDLARMLREKGYILISSEEIKKRSASRFLTLGLFNRVSTAEKMIFARNIAVMIKAGLSLVKALEILAGQAKSRKFQLILTVLAEDIRRGKFLSESMKAHPGVFSSLFVSMVKAGEEGGNLVENLRLIAYQLEREHNLLKKIRGAMIYPAIIVITMVVIGVLMLIYVVPTLISTFKELEISLPPSTQFVIFVSSFIVSHTLIFLTMVLVAAASAAYLVQTENGKKTISAIFFRLPILKVLVQKINAARTARTLGSLIGSGVDVLKALEITEEVLQNYRYKKALEEARLKVQKGSPISEVFKTKSRLYPALVGEMMAVGEETGQFSKMLVQLADFYEEEVADATKDISTVIEPILMVVIGAVVGFFAISMIQPLYSSLAGL